MNTDSSSREKEHIAAALKKAEHTLREYDRRFASLAAVSPLAIIRFDQSVSNCIYVNERWGELSGHAIASAMGLGYQKSIHSDDLKKFIEYTQKLSQSTSQTIGGPIDLRHVDADGSLKWMQLNLAKELDEDDNLSGYVGTLSDISKIRQADERLTQLKQRLQRVLECGSIGSWEWDVQEERLVWDDQMFEIYGVDREDFRGVLADWTDRLHPDDFEDQTTNYKERIGADGTEFRILRPNDEVRHIYGWVYYEKDSNDQMLRAVGLNLDVTDTRRAQVALLESESKFERVVEGIPGMIYRCILSADGDHSAIYVSSQARELYEVEPEDVIDDFSHLLNRIHREDIAGFEHALWKSTESLEPLKYEYRVLLPGGRIRWLQTMGKPTRIENGGTAWDGVVLDISERKEMELTNNVLVRTTRTKDQFIANMSHELRTPLSAILSMTEGMQKGVFGELTSRQRECLNTVEESGLHLLELINEVLDLAKVESGQIELNFSEIHIAQLCDSSLSLIAQQAENKNIEMVLKVSRFLPKFAADEKIIRQILLNLLSNAVKFTPIGGQVTLEVKGASRANEKCPDLLQISITDNGIGIETGKLDSLFEPFVQVDSSLTRSYEGTGLGLALVKRYVELHAGTIRVKSEIGAGSCFTIELPFLSYQVGEVTKLTGRKHSALSRRVDNTLAEPKSAVSVLLAEDNENLAAAMTAVLGSSGYRVSRVTNGQQAVDYTRKHKPSLILMDIQMPVMDGLEAIRQIRSMTEFVMTPIIALSGFVMPEESSRCLEAGANKFLGKPCPMDILIAEIERLLESKRQVDDPDPVNASGEF